MRTLYDQSVFSDVFLSEWHDATLRLDKKCILYNRKAEKAFRPMINEFIKWMTSTEYGDEYDEEEEAEEEKSKAEPQVKEETEAERNQRELIEAQKRA